MKKYTYNFEIKDLLTQFVAAFDDTVIKRYDAKKNPRQLVDVRYVFAPKQRVMYDVINKAQNITLPVVTVDLVSVSYDSSRAFNKVNKIETYITDRDETVTMDMPTPINLTVNMSILGRYMQDVEQIITNFAPYTNPYIVICWKEPAAGNEVLEIRTEVLWNENITLSCPTETTYSDKFRVVADTSFTIKGWLFKNENVRSKPIYFIENNFVAVDSSWGLTQSVSSLDYENFVNEFKTDPDKDYYVDTVSISGTPIIDGIFANNGSNMVDITYTDPIIINREVRDYNFVLTGNNYKKTTAVLLSSNNPTLTEGLTSIDTTYTGTASGFLLPLSSYSILSNNTMNITVPYLSGSGEVDFLIQNPAGWTSSRTISGFYMIAE